MQEEIEHKTVVLIENCAKLTGRELKKAIAKLLQQNNSNLKKFSEKPSQEPHGQMTVKELAAQNKGIHLFSYCTEYGGNTKDHRHLCRENRNL